ncbi:MAG TPA: ATP-binding protein [Thermoanaerobaculia bacterium]|jgi:predicted AAA+ superfamily ATPase|nr:ATP-binding protein [Thermoanaerobaculia bacterium]
MFRRSMTPLLLDALGDRPVVLLNGARQVGKSTLAREVATEARPASYLTLDDAAVLAAASHDPAGFLAGLSGPVTLDEVQRAPDLFLAIKAEVDRDRRPGRFLLTGSADFLLLPRVSESLAGRIEILTLWPLSQGEIEGRPEGFVDALFGPTLAPLSGAAEMPEDREAIFARALLGGYPEIVSKESAVRRRAWFNSYVATILQRDVRELANIEGLTALPRLLSLLAARASSLLNYSELSRSSGLSQTTLKRYFALLEATFLVQLLPAWASNLSKRLTKSPKILFGDTGLLAHNLGLDAARLALEPELAGLLLENFVLMEIKKQAAWSAVQPRLFHYRTLAGQEVDLILEDASGRCVGIEVKASTTLGARDMKPLTELAEALGKRFVRGILLYTGRTAVPFGERLHALPISSLWHLAPPAP